MKEDLATRLVKARTDRDWSQSDLARALKVTPQTVQQWEKGGGIRQARVGDVARALGVSAEWLLFGSHALPMTVGEARASYGLRRGLGVPLVAWLMVDDWITGRDPAIEGELLCPVEVSGRAFAVRITGASMEPRYHAGEIVFVDPEVLPANGRTVVVIPAPLEPATLRQVVTEDGQRFLRVLNPDWPGPKLSAMPDEGKIAGTVVGKWTAE